MEAAKHWTEEDVALPQTGVALPLLLALVGQGVMAPLLGLPAAAVALAALILLGAWPLIAKRVPAQPFGLGNAATLTRLAGVGLLAGLLVAPEARVTQPWDWAVLALAILALDALDGPLARWQGLVSPFGARFDMEVDGLLVLVLSLLLWRLGLAPAWILAAGLLRPAWLLFEAVRQPPPLEPPPLLEPSWRRRLCCGVAICGLAVALVPGLSAAQSGLLASAAALLLALSFALDAARALRGRANLPRRRFS